MIRAVLLDAAGTLLRPREPVGETYARIARAHGVDLPAWRLDDAFRRALRAAPPIVFPAESLERERSERERSERGDRARRERSERVRALERAWWRDVVRATFRSAAQMVRFADFEACFEGLFAHYARPDAWVALPGAASQASGRAKCAKSAAKHASKSATRCI